MIRHMWHTLVNSFILWFAGIQEPKSFNNYSEILSTRNFVMRKANFCDGHDNTLLILVKSGAANFQRRCVTRELWVNSAKQLNLPVLFVVGRPESELIQQQLNLENTLHNDILEVDFKEDYRNLTLKSISMLYWISTECPRVKWYLSCDDDVQVNVKRVLHFALNEEEVAMFGYVQNNARIERSVLHKNYLAYEYSEQSFPKYLSGGGYFINGQLVQNLTQVAFDPGTRTMVLDDVHVTGVLAEKIGASRLWYHRIFYCNEAEGGINMFCPSDRQLIEQCNGFYRPTQGYPEFARYFNSKKDYNTSEILLLPICLSLLFFIVLFFIAFYKISNSVKKAAQTICRIKPFKL